jgi:hypothetical protein
MNYSDRVTASFREFWKSPALLSVLILEFIITILLAFLFFFSDTVLVGMLNKAAVAQVIEQTGTIDWHVFLNTKTMVVLAVLLLIQGFVFIYIDSFFKSGFYGMLKNLVQDGTTTFNEFMPMAKRYWPAMFRFLLVRYALMLLVLAPFFVAAIQFVATTPALVTQGQYIALFTTLAAGALLALLISFWFLYGEAVIVFDDARASEGIRGSMQLANKNVGFSLATLFTFIAIAALGVIAASIISFPFDYAAEATKSFGLAILADVVRFVLNLITISATVVASIFVFLSYRDLTEAPAVRKAPAVKNAHVKRKKA